MTLQKPIKYRLYNNYLWVRSGENQEWVKGKVIKSKIFTPINQHFGENVSYYRTLGTEGHNGIDWYAPDSTCLYAVCDGEILQVNEDPNTGYGKAIFILSDVYHEGGKKKRLYIVEGHLKKILCQEGDQVKAGQLIGLTDNTGKYTKGAHLHEGARILEPYVSGMQPISSTGYGYYNNNMSGYIDHESLIANRDVHMIDFLKEGKLIQRTDTKNGAVGQVYEIVNGVPKFLDSGKDPVTRHIPLVDWVFEKNKTGLEKGFITAINEEQWEQIKDL